MMLKEIFLALVRCGAGFLLITPLFIYARNSGLLPASTFEDPHDPVFLWFFKGVMAIWLVTVLINVADLFNLLPQHPRLRPILAWSPVYLPVLYGILCFLWFFRGQLL